MASIKAFAQKHIYIFSVLFIAVSVFLLTISVTMIFKHTGFTSINAVLSYILPMIFIFSIIFILAVGKQIGFHKKNIGTGILLGWLAILFGIINFVSGLMDTGAQSLTLIKSPEIIYFTFAMFLIGLYEELLCRGVLLNIMINKWGHTKKGVIKSVILSSAIFGAIHLFNLLVHPELIFSTLAQVIYAFFIGVFFASVYLRCKNIWSVIILHALIDWCGWLFGNFSTSSTANIISDISIPTALSTILITLPFALAGLFLLRKVKPNELTTTGTT